MSTSINPQEIYLLERYVSLDYFCKLRDTWAKMVGHLESCLNAFVQDLPTDYRKRKLPEQPDIVWGQRVLPNFRDTLQSLNTGFILLSHGDFKGLTYAWGPRNDFKGQMDFWSGWMSEADENLYRQFLHNATTLAGNICTTEGAYWDPGDLSNYCDHWGPLDAPSRWPAYQIRKDISVVSGQPVRQSGIYVPDVDNSCAEFHSTSYATAPQARVLVGVREIPDPETGERWDEERIIEKRDCVWYLIERAVYQPSTTEDTAITSDGQSRVLGGEVCPETGFYFTPARTDSRRLFQKGEIMPSFDAAYGTTIWQRDGNQG
jgi:hypothetical protein